MPRRLCFVLFVVLVVSMPGLAQEPAPKSPIVGLWLGTLKVGPINLRLALQVDAGKDNALTGKIISIDQNRAEIPVKTLTWEKDQLTLDMPAAVAKFTGKYDAKGPSITGEFVQAGQKFPLEFKRIDKLLSIHRPQHPKEPFPYLAEEVTFENPSAKVKLAGTLTRPKGDGPYTAVVLVSGSGPQDRDETLFDHKPFLVLADHLTRAGYAVLRYDDRGVGKSTGAFVTCTTADFASDASSAVTFLQGRKEIDRKRIGIIGHSEGGLVAPIVAADRPNDIAFIGLLAGPGVPGDQIIASQVRDIMKASGEPEEVIELAAGLQTVLMEAVKSSDTTEAAEKALRKAAEEYVKKLTVDQRKKLELDEKGSEDQLKAWNKLAAPWERFFLKHDPAKVLQNVKCPVLAITGDKDLQVDAKINQAAIAAALKAGGNAKGTIRTLPGLNHLFQKCKTGLVSEYPTIEETFNTEALKVIEVWLSGLAKVENR